MTVDLRWQFDLVWALADLHLASLADDDFLWEPTEVTWTVRPDAGGVWHADWSDTEPQPIPVPTIAWLTWHVDWWWSSAISHLTGEAPREPRDVTWPGEGAAVVARLRHLADRWRKVLAGVDPNAPSAYPWGEDSGHTVAHTALWVNVELTKNTAEIGQLRLIRAAHRSKVG
ncbi:DinB family protein [Mycolicibacterium sp. XJ2]